MRHQYRVQCKTCGQQTSMTCTEELNPKDGGLIPCFCPKCEEETLHALVIIRRIRAELNRQAAEERLREEIRKRCEFYGFSCRFYLQSVIINMAEAFYGVPPQLIQRCETLVPQDMLQVIRRFNKACRHLGGMG